jgi:hypothetical protein
MTCLARDLQISRDGAAVVAGLACGLVGTLEPVRISMWITPRG